MGLRYYDDALQNKFSKWIPNNSKLRIFGPDESKRFFESLAIDNGDKALQLPAFTLSRNNDLELERTIKERKTFNGFQIVKGNATLNAIDLNVIPIKAQYQLDIYTKTREEADDYVRQWIFKLVNNPKLFVSIPYNYDSLKKLELDMLTHVFNIRLLPNIADNSDIAEKTFSGQFYRWTIQFEITDAFLFNVKYVPNTTIEGLYVSLLSKGDPTITEVIKELNPSDDDTPFEEITDTEVNDTNNSDENNNDN